MASDKLPVNIYISPNSSDNSETIEAIKKGVQEALEKFEGKSIVFFHIKNIHTGPVGKHHPPHHNEERPWPKFGHHKHHMGPRGKHGHYHFKGPHGPGHFREKHRHHRWGNWGYHSQCEQETVQNSPVNIEEIANTNATDEKNHNSQSSGEWSLLEYKSADEGAKSGNVENEEELRVRFDSMDVTKSV